MIKIRKGNIFSTECQTVVNTINTQGVMGAGIAYEFKLRYPEMFEKYKFLCEKKEIQIGKLWIYRVPEIYKKIYNEKYDLVLNFPTKIHWKFPSKIEFIEKGLDKFVKTYKEKGIISIAFPLLGAGKGGIDKDISKEIMIEYLKDLDILIEIWDYDTNAKDYLFEDFKYKFLSLDVNTLKVYTGLKLNIIEKLKVVLREEEINSFGKLLKTKGIGKNTIEKIFEFMRIYNKPIQKSLFSYS